MAVLKGISGGTKALAFELTRDETTIGRHGANMLVIPDPSVSAFHCAIVKAGGRYTLRDLDSTNGTKVNGEPIKVRRLLNGNILQIGNIELLLEGEDIEGEDTTTQAARPPPAVGDLPAPASAQSQFKIARRNTSTVVWITVGVIAFLSALFVAAVVYSISHLK